MARKKKGTLRQAQEDIGIFTMVGVGGSVGVKTISKIGAGTSVAATAPAGVGNIMGQMPLLGTIRGQGMILSAVKEYIPKYPLKAKKRR